MRAELSSFWQEHKSFLQTAFKELRSKAHKNWYVSVWGETRGSTNYTINPKTEKILEKETTGVVLRIFDGKTLFEQAVSEVSQNALKDAVLALLDRASDFADTPEVKIFKTPSWGERLTEDLDEEIKSQIPSNHSPADWVHFGVRIEKPLWTSHKEAVDSLKSQFQALLNAPKIVKPDYSQISAMLIKEDMLFIDEEVSLSQSVLRSRLAQILTHGEDRAYATHGGVGGLEAITVTQEDISKLCEQLKHLVHAERLKPGAYKLVMSPGVTGVFAHEAFGHTQEGDTWVRGRSKAKELYAQNVKVGNQHATIINNPAAFTNGVQTYGAWGSYFFDEEGWFARPQVLVENGFLKTPMTNLLSHVKLNVPRSANGKRENWSRGIYTRQTNTYFTPGEHTLDELIQMVDYGFLAEECSGGMEDPKGMGIQVGIQYVQEIKDGKLTGRTFKGPNGGAIQMTGYVPDCLNHIVAKTMIDPTGKNKSTKNPVNDVGGCAKYHKEFVYAGCGGPYMLVENSLLG
jgi:TldD protein